MSPALGLYFNWGPLSLATGPIAPLIYMLALLISPSSSASFCAISVYLQARLGEL